MKDTYIVVDSTSYIEEEYLKLNEIEVVSLSVELDNETHVEGLVGTYGEYFEKLKASKNFPKTSQPPVGMFEKTYRRLIDKGAKKILVITFSSQISGTYNSANLAANTIEDAGLEIKVIDTMSAVGIYRYCVEKAISMIDEFSFDEIEANVKDIINRSNIDLTVDSIDYLKRGGRLSNIQAVIASVLDIKPIITIIDGKVVANGKTRGKNKAVREMINRLPKDIEYLSVEHVQNRKDAERIKKIIEKEYTNIEINIAEIGPIIGSHLGSGGIGIVSIKK